MAKGIKTVEFSTDWDDTLETGTFTAVADFLMEGLDPGTEEEYATEMGDGATEQDGAKLAGAFRATGTDLPTPGTRTWFQFTPFEGNPYVIGGADGCRVRVTQSALKPFGGGPAYALVQYEVVRGVSGSVINEITA